MDFTPIQATRLTGCSVSQVRYWDRIGLVSPSVAVDPPRYAFEDLVALRMVCSLLDAGLPLQRIRRAVEYLRASGEDVQGLRLVTDGATVFACRSDGEVLDALRGGLLAWSDVVTQLRLDGVSLPDALTSAEAAERASAHAPELAAPMEGLRFLVDRAAYSPHEPGTQEVAIAWAAARRVVAVLERDDSAGKRMRRRLTV